MTFSLKIRVNDYQYQLLCAQLGPSPYKATYKNPIGKLILSQYNNTDGIKRTNKQYQGRIYEIDLPSSWVQNFGVRFISDESVKDFIEYLDSQFKIKMFTYIDAVLDFKESYNKERKKPIVAKMKQAALRFLEKNGMNEDLLPFETIKKAYNRYKGHMESIDRVA